MPAPDQAACETGPCVFGVNRLLPLIDVLSTEVAGVRAADDIEPVHRMRVASRRLRAALPLFSACFPEKDYRHWMREIKKITRALGNARDTDVQIAFLKKYLKAQAGTVPAGATGPVRCLYLLVIPLPAPCQLQKRRKILQQQVISVLDEIEETQGTSFPAGGLLPTDSTGKEEETGAVFWDTPRCCRPNRQTAGRAGPV